MPEIDNSVKDETSEFGKHSMRALLSVCIQEAVTLALIDSCIADIADAEYKRQGEPGMDRWVEISEREQDRLRDDIHRLPSEAMARMDPVALAQNVVTRLLGTGGWVVGGIYAGNATPREIFEASIHRPDRDRIAELAFDLGLKPAEDGMFRLPEDDELPPPTAS